MRNNNYYHSSVNVIDYPFDWISVDIENKNEYAKLVKKFNLTKHKEEKIQLSKNFPTELFPKCRICGSIILNSNFIISYNIKENKIKLSLPQIYCRKIDGVKHYLSCCEDCLLDHFKDCPPKAQKYYFMKANKYGQYSYGYSDEEYKKICSMIVGVTEKSMIRKWGEIEGKKRWKEYCKKQSLKNKFEYKKKHYGWDKNKFNKFNKSRAVTKENLINKYGKELGEQYFNDYVNKQKLTKSEKYMIQKYGKEKTEQINKSKAQTLENYINRLGYDEGIKQFEIMLSHHYNYFSKISQKFFNELDSYIGSRYTTYYATKNGEYGVNLNNKNYIRLDYFILELNLCIEFNGTYYHADPNIFKPDDYPNPHNKKLSAQDIWNNDATRYKLLKDIRNIDTIVVWENEYNKGIDIKKFIKEILKIEL